MSNYDAGQSHCLVVRGIEQNYVPRILIRGVTVKEGRKHDANASEVSRERYGVLCWGAFCLKFMSL